MTQTQKKDRHYYALSDSFTGNYPGEPTDGFANTSIAIAFRSKADRDEWLDTTQLLKAQAITRQEAIKLTETDQGRKMVAICSPSQKACEPYAVAHEDTLILWESEYQR